MIETDFVFLFTKTILIGLVPMIIYFGLKEDKTKSDKLIELKKEYEILKKDIEDLEN